MTHFSDDDKLMPLLLNIAMGMIYNYQILKYHL